MVNLRHSCPITQSEGAKTFVTGVYLVELWGINPNDAERLFVYA